MRASNSSKYAGPRSIRDLFIAADSHHHLAKRGILILALALFGLFGTCARADMIELTNGDHYRGTVISMTQSNMEFLSEIQGRVKLPRDKIAQITLHEVVAKSVSVTKPAGSPASAPVTVSGAPDASAAALPQMLLPQNAAAPVSQTDAVIQQMRQQGVDPKLIDQVQEQIFGKSSPEAAQKFNEMVGGLTSGSMSVNDLRNQAQAAINQIKSAKKEFGSDAGDMLDGYLVILQKFVADADAGGSLATSQPAPATK